MGDERGAAQQVAFDGGGLAQGVVLGAFAAAVGAGFSGGDVLAPLNLTEANDAGRGHTRNAGV